MDVLIQVTPQTGDPIIINNDNLIRAVVSLRSDLSIINPTLPESEINIEAYFDTDISEILAAIPDETPVTYQAGYEGDMSPVRKFYLAEQITWADNVMSIHAVDAVHLLDVETFSGIRVGAVTQNCGLQNIIMLLQALLLYAGVDAENGKTYFSSIDRNSGNLGDAIVDAKIPIWPKQPIRELIATMSNLLRCEFEPGFLLNGRTAYYINYVDAGIPKISIDKPTTKWAINEDDCGDTTVNTGRKITKLNVKHNTVSRGNMNGGIGRRELIGSGTWFYEGGASLDFDSEYIEEFTVAYRSDANGLYALRSLYENSDETIGRHSFIRDIQQIRPTAGPGLGGEYLVKNDLPFGVMQRATNTDNKLYTQFVPWTEQQASLWSTYGLATNATVSLEIHGQAYTLSTDEFSYGSSGVSAELTQENILGRLVVYGSGDFQGTSVNVLPGIGYEQLLNRSNITGSFTWKGDPRMQPRDVFTFHRLDGTDEVCTLENITITHEKGGTSAEITYRKGIC